MRRRLTALLFLSVVAVLPVTGSSAIGGAAADALVQRFRTLPVVVTTWPTSDPDGADSAAADTTRAGATGGGAGGA